MHRGSKKRDVKPSLRSAMFNKTIYDKDLKLWISVLEEFGHKTR